MNAYTRFRPVLLGAVGALIVLALGLSRDVRAVAAAMVQVVNTAQSPVYTKRADDPARHAFATRVFASTTFQLAFTVPADKYLVIDDVSGFAYSSSVVSLSIDGKVGGTNAERRIPYTSSRAPGVSYLVATPIRMVLDPGSAVYMGSDSTLSPDYGGVNIDVKGYYVDAN